MVYWYRPFLFERYSFQYQRIPFQVSLHHLLRSHQDLNNNTSCRDSSYKWWGLGRLHHQPPSTSMYYLVLALVDHTCTLHIANFLLSIHRHTDHILQIPTKFLIPCVSRILGSNSISCNTQVSIDNLTKLENFFTLDPLRHLTVPLRMHWLRKSRSQALWKVY